MSTVMAFGFTFSANPSPETCFGNGSISFSASGTDPNGTILYIVYKLPNVTTPYATLNSNLLTGLSSATYRIIAKETVGNISTQKQLEVIIDKIIVPLVFTIQSINRACSNFSDITITITSGTAVSYEIFYGPLHFPLQSSNTFIGLPVGVYKVRVYDNCGVGVVQTFTVNQNAAAITIGAPTFSNTVPSSCNFTIVTNTITPATGTELGYPLTLTYTINPPGGAAAISFSTILLSGNLFSQTLDATIPDYINQIYSYDLTIVDACNSTYSQNFIVNKNITIASDIVVLDCNQNYFNLNVANFTPPYSLNFTSVPTGFIPVVFNSNYPGLYNQDTVQFGNLTTIVPFGHYEVGITDNCGRTSSASFDVISHPPIPKVVGNTNNCLNNTGTIVVSIPNYSLNTVVLTVAPANYVNTLPQDFTSLIDFNGVLTIKNLPIGHYEFQVTDNCGSIFSVLSCNLPIYVNKGLKITQRPGCDLQRTSIELVGNNGKLVSVSIISAPPTYGNNFPYDISSNIVSTGRLYLDNLPAGNYTMKAVDECGFINIKDFIATGYEITINSFSLQPNCGSFDIPLQFVSNGIANQAFWLQKLIDPINNVWGNPINQTIYIEGTVPNATNSYLLINNATNFNIPYNGVFRIVRSFSSYNNGININNSSVASPNKLCIEILNPTMEFHQVLEILNVSRIPCTPSGNLDVVILTNGIQPLKYTIIKKNNLPYFFDNGNSNIFYNLAPGNYVFQVEDICGNSIPTNSFDVSSLLSLVNMGQPNNILQCKMSITGNEIFDLTQLNSTILGNQSTSEYTLTYYTSQTDAMSATNAIANLTTFNPTTNPQTIYARLIFNALPNCYEIGSFDLIVGQKPVINLQTDYLNCTLSPVYLDVSVGNLSTTTYSWTGDIVSSIPSVTIFHPGENTIHLEATNLYGTQSCINSDNITVTNSHIPQFDHIDIVDWTLDENSITIYTSNVGDFEYSIDDSIYQNSPIFSNLLPGEYTVFVRDKKGCGKIEKTVYLLYYKRYFTPNGDGINDTWFVENSSNEPNFKVVIFDRYGKAIKSFDSNSIGWDGTYNGQLQFATDYWFVVYRQDGRIHKGHFSLKR
jgi:gliding motility-associated-like protein